MRPGVAADPSEAGAAAGEVYSLARTPRIKVLS
jgi:hypothetical protein